MSLDSHIEKVLWSREQIQDRVTQLATQITHDFFSGTDSPPPPVVIGVVTGAFCFLADLVWEIHLPLTVDFVRAESYGSGTESTGAPQISLNLLKLSVKDKHVILVEDIVDTGNTLSCLVAQLKSSGASSVSVCAFLDKPTRRMVEVELVGEGKFYTGFEDLVLRVSISNLGSRTLTSLRVMMETAPCWSVLIWLLGVSTWMLIMFNFPSNSIDYLHRTSRTARMGVKGKVTSLVTKKNASLADRIEEAIRKNKSWESLTIDNVRRDNTRARVTEEKGRNVKLISQRNKTTRTTPVRTPKRESGKAAAPSNLSKSVEVSKPLKHSTASKTKSASPAKSSSKHVDVSKPGNYSSKAKSGSSGGKKKQSDKSPASRLNVVGFRGKKESLNLN